MKISFDSNVWELLFDPGRSSLRCSHETGVIVDGLRSKRIRGFICESAFRIEAVQTMARAAYLANTKIDFITPDQKAHIEGKVHLFSFGPDDSAHPGLPIQLAPKIENARRMGVKLMNGQNWMFLPRPASADLDAMRIQEGHADRGAREQVSADLFHAIELKGVGFAKIDLIRKATDIANGFESPGWSAFKTCSAEGELKKIHKACAEWADAELVAAHLAYGNDFLCSDDQGKSSGPSVFNDEHRRWLNDVYGVKFMSMEELSRLLDVRGKATQTPA